MPYYPVMPPVVSRKKQFFSDLGLLYAAAIWGSTFFLVKDALGDIDPVIMVAYRFLMAGVLLGSFVIMSGRNLLAGLGRAFFLSVILWLLYVPQTIGLKFTTASNSGFITGLFVLFTPIFLRIIFKRTPTVMEMVASFVSLSGLWVLTGGMHDVNLGDMLTLVAAMTYALHVLYSDKYMKAGIDPYVISAQQFLMVGLMSLATGLILDLPFSIGSVRAGGIVAFLALFPTLSAFLIQMLAQRFTSPLKVSLIFALEPVFAAVFAWTAGGEEFIERRALGGLLIFLALILSGLPNPSKRPSPVAASDQDESGAS